MKRLLLSIVTAALATPSLAQEQPPAIGMPTSSDLAVGQSAPPLKFEKLLKGDPLTGFERGRVYVVEFWATWCGPCIQAVPHLSELQTRYKDRGVTIIGTNVREMREDGGGWTESFDEETRASVESFVGQQGVRMAYTVVYDGAAKAMDNAWLKASGSEALPTTFIVDRVGLIAWIGHPMVLRMPLHEIVEGHWDNATGPQRVKQAEEAYIGAMRLFSTDPTAGLAAWDRAAAEYPLLAADLIAPKFHALLASGQYDAAYAAGELLVDAAIGAGNSAALNGVAWSIVNPAVPITTRNLDLAMKAAAKASELAAQKDPGILDTLARVHFCRGDVERAIEIQSRAVELADQSMKLRLTPALDEYTKARK